MMYRLLSAVAGLQLVITSQLLAQRTTPRRIRGDTTGAPSGCSASAAIAAIDLFLAAMRSADSAGLARAMAPRFTFSTGKFTPADTFFVTHAIPELLRYARKRARAHERMTLQAVTFNGWRGGELQFGPIYFLRFADDLGHVPLGGIGKGAFACGQGLTVFNLAQRPAFDPGPGGRIMTLPPYVR
jgi:hypothetical protein